MWTNDLDTFPLRYFLFPQWNRSFRFFSVTIHFHRLPYLVCSFLRISFCVSFKSFFWLFCRMSNFLLRTCTFHIAITFSAHIAFIAIFYFVKWVDTPTNRILAKFMFRTHIRMIQWRLHIASVLNADFAHSLLLTSFHPYCEEATSFCCYTSQKKRMLSYSVYISHQNLYSRWFHSHQINAIGIFVVLNHHFLPFTVREKKMPKSVN